MAVDRKLIALSAIAVTLVATSTAEAHSKRYWIKKQIRVATIIGRHAAKDPWPNCPDPIWNRGATWWDTVRCENRGNWYDSPGYYRCGLQFAPMWERIYGRLCP